MSEIPLRATYRLQLHAGFTFKDATAIIPYLAALGVSHVYCSPYFKARTGSTHGYDVVAHNRFNPEIGEAEDFENFVQSLRANVMGHIADFVPNHVGIMGGENKRWMDVLAHGETSKYAGFFDIDWHPADAGMDGKVLVPILGENYGAVLDRGELQLRHETETSSYSVYYHEHRLPINPRDYPYAAEILRTQSEAPTNAAALPKETGSGSDALHELLERQAYRLAYWRLASDEVNYRRFFDINELAALRMENPEVFEEMHQLTFELLKTGKIDGLRIDHPDGLYDPAQYFQRLQARGAALGRAPLYIVAEKICAYHERLPKWPIAGSTGYDFANLVNGLFVDRAGRGRLDRTYRAFTGEMRSWEEIVIDAKQLILRTSLAAEVNVLANQLHRIARGDRRTRDFSLNGLRQALRDLISCFPVYRTYATATVSTQDERFIAWAVERARKRSQAADVAVFDFLSDILLHRTAAGVTQTSVGAAAVRNFGMKFQQVTSPAAAKGVEDTAFYRFNRLASLNEVGGEPDVFGVSVAAFHKENRRRLDEWPDSMLATSTHDTKRSEDVRARIDVLSEMPGAWRAALARWSRMNRSLRTSVDGQSVPAPEDEYLLYQTLLGSWPLQPTDDAALNAYSERIQKYAVKAAREAKVRTSWANVNAAYEQALRNFVRAILTPGAEINAGAAGAISMVGDLFLSDFAAVRPRIAYLGLLNSLAQTALKLTVPGVPDIYQGCELWDFSLVDPDNRRPVDFNHRTELLSDLQRWPTLPVADWQRRLAGLWSEPADGRAKLYLTWRILALRRAHPKLFSRGRYLPIQVAGAHSANLCAFARTGTEGALIVATPRLTAKLITGDPPFDPSRIVWDDTELTIKQTLQCIQFTSLLDGESYTLDASSGTHTLPIERLFSHFPLALLFAPGPVP